MPDRERTFRADAVVLKRRHLGEADSIIVFYNDVEGRFEGIAKGVRKTRSRKGGHLEPLSRVDVQLAKGRNLDIVMQAQLIEPFASLRDDLDQVAAGLHLAELVDAVTSDGLAHRGLYRALLEGLSGLDAGVPVANVHGWFEMRLLSLLGHAMQVAGCAVCGSALAPEPAFFSASAGGLVCRNCRNQSGVGHEIPVRLIKVLRFLEGATMGEVAALRLDETAAAGLARVIDAAMRPLIEREPRARNILGRPRTGPVEL